METASNVRSPTLIVRMTLRIPAVRLVNNQARLNGLIDLLGLIQFNQSKLPHPVLLAKSSTE
jgi:hypothetical protein